VVWQPLTSELESAVMIVDGYGSPPENPIPDCNVHFVPVEVPVMPSLPNVRPTKIKLIKKIAKIWEIVILFVFIFFPASLFFWMKIKKEINYI
jgi:hypothetical protein